MSLKELTRKIAHAIFDFEKDPRVINLPKKKRKMTMEDTVAACSHYKYSTNTRFMGLPDNLNESNCTFRVDSPGVTVLPSTQGNKEDDAHPHG